MSINAVNAAFASRLGVAGTLIGSTLHYIDGGRIQLIAVALTDPDGNRHSVIRAFSGNIDVSDAAKTMAADWQAGTLASMITEGKLAATSPKIAGVQPTKGP